MMFPCKLESSPYPCKRKLDIFKGVIMKEVAIPTHLVDHLEACLIDSSGHKIKAQ